MAEYATGVAANAYWPFTVPHPHVALTSHETSPISLLITKNSTGILVELFV
jgi:hypothetical protein